MLKHFLIVIRNTLSCLNLLSSVHLDRAHKYWVPPHPLPPLPFFPHWQLKLELATFFSVSHFLCALRHVWAPHLDTHMRRETHAGADVTVCVHAGARTGNAVPLPELITLNTKKPFPPCDLSKMEVLKANLARLVWLGRWFTEASPVVHMTVLSGDNKTIWV